MLEKGSAEKLLNFSFANSRLEDLDKRLRKYNADDQELKLKEELVDRKRPREAIKEFEMDEVSSMHTVKNKSYESKPASVIKESNGEQITKQEININQADFVFDIES